MPTAIAHVTVLVEDVDEAKEWYTGTFGFEARADGEFAPGMRWVTVSPPGSDTEVVLLNRTRRSTARSGPSRCGR